MFLAVFFSGLWTWLCWPPMAATSLHLLDRVKVGGCVAGPPCCHELLDGRKLLQGWAVSLAADVKVELLVDRGASSWTCWTAPSSFNVHLSKVAASLGGSCMGP
ncbi:hypothetical protein LR48_Vigan11g074700 [Vigna angularis]|uniref:Secreted protein n=1 Tax=Phaseolus angularis TaxID=3914 RepID=A0A0L9VSH6_PHAAN|nr:hypothetical protein LR48_Vigan11g074700 [Vigna angularis]